MNARKKGGLLLEHVKRAFCAPGNLAAGATTAVTSVVIGNPLPLILWGIGSGLWTAKATTDGRYLPAIREEERALARAQASHERDALAQRIALALDTPPLLGWVQGNALPNYSGEHAALVEMRDRIARIARDRTEVNADAGSNILARLDTMLSAYLKFVASRIAYLQMLTGARMALEDTPARTPRPAEPPGVFTRFLRVFFVTGAPVVVQPHDAEAPHAWRSPQDRRERDRDGRFVPRGNALDCAAAETTVQEQITQLRKRAEQEPATKAQREKHIALLERRLELLGEIRERDQRVAAQLEAFRDAFTFVLERMSATQFDAAEVVSYMDGLAENVQDTERFVETMAPLTDATFLELDGVTV